MAQSAWGSQVFIPDGCDVQLKATAGGSYTSVGTVMGDVGATHNFDINTIVANDGKKRTQYRNETLAANFILGNLNATNIGTLSAGMFTVVDTAGSAVTDIADQEIAASWEDNTGYALTMDSTVEGEIRTTAQPTLTSVTLNHGTPEVLVEDTDYVVQDTGGGTWEIQFISGNMGSSTPTAFSITIVYGSNTPIASTKITGGKSSGEFTPIAVKFIHTDTASKTRFLEIYAANPESGSFAFGFRAVSTGEIEQMPITITGEIDGDRTSGDQLFNWGYDDGAA